MGNKGNIPNRFLPWYTAKPQRLPSSRPPIFNLSMVRCVRATKHVFADHLPKPFVFGFQLPYVGDECQD